jgi:hypothetical protein
VDLWVKTCPKCEDGMIRVYTHTEYQGVSPQGGYVEFTDEVEADCDCMTQDELEEFAEDVGGSGWEYDYPDSD